MLVDSRLIAKNLFLQHKHVFEQIKDFKVTLRNWGLFGFKPTNLKPVPLEVVQRNMRC